MKIDLTPAQLAKYFDQTLLKAYVSDSDFKAFWEESDHYHFKTVMINSAPVKKCKEYLKNSDVLVGATIGFPLGQTTIEAKVFETQKAIEDGADEIDFVYNIAELKSRNISFVEREMQEIVNVCRAHNKVVKVIFENCYLTQDEKKILCEIAMKADPDFIKTSTGFGTPAPGVAVGATVADVKLMKSLVGDAIKVKAAGGVRRLEDALVMIDAGAERIGTSAGVKIVEELKVLRANSPILG
ncbi:MAG TPA: deoxyribose-phosphate aldolase [Ruminococcaceae bacterium]|nr:deoxyribose-phosphate aldolase [Oscillospiraceae bacterium]